MEDIPQIDLFWLAFAGFSAIVIVGFAVFKR